MKTKGKIPAVIRLMICSFYGALGMEMFILVFAILYSRTSEAHAIAMITTLKNITTLATFEFLLLLFLGSMFSCLAVLQFSLFFTHTINKDQNE